MARFPRVPPRKILTVFSPRSQRPGSARAPLSALWVAGEISNFTLAKSGHAYFVMKDEHAQVRCVNVRQRHRISSDAARWHANRGAGARQLVRAARRFPAQCRIHATRRLGALFEAFLIAARQASKKEGLFDAETKRAMPSLPRARSAVITSRRRGASGRIDDAARRKPVDRGGRLPCKSRGEGAAERSPSALEIAGRLGGCDVVLLVRRRRQHRGLVGFQRGDSWRGRYAHARSGRHRHRHETDFTIADFVADRRAPTRPPQPSWSVRTSQGLFEGISRLTAARLARSRRARDACCLVDHLARRLVHPEARLRLQSELLGQLRLRLGQAAAESRPSGAGKVARLLQRPRQGPQYEKLLATSVQLVARLRAATHATLERAGSACARRSPICSHLDPAAVLERGYKRRPGRIGTDRSLRGAVWRRPPPRYHVCGGRRPCTRRALSLGIEIAERPLAIGPRLDRGQLAPRSTIRPMRPGRRCSRASAPPRIQVRQIGDPTGQAEPARSSVAWRWQHAAARPIARGRQSFSVLGSLAWPLQKPSDFSSAARTGFRLAACRVSPQLGRAVRFEPAASLRGEPACAQGDRRAAWSLELLATRKARLAVSLEMPSNSLNVRD